MPKPRTNAAAIEYWAAAILDREPAPAIEVNSVIVNNDVVFSYGSHWPMGAIDRDAKGRARRVFLNSDHCSSQGWHHTSTDQWHVNLSANAAVAAAKWPIEVIRRPMGTGWRVSGDGMIECRPKSSDPRPPSDWSCEIPPVFHATDPGPEPVDDGVGCIAGQREEYSYEDSMYIGSDSRTYGIADISDHTQDQGYAYPRTLAYVFNPPLPGDSTYWHHYGENAGRALHARRAANGVITWRKPREWEWQRAERGEEEDKFCPHCVAFMREHSRWSERFHGPRWGRNRGRGWRLYSEMLENFGSIEEWREQRLIAYRRMRAGRKAFAEWESRNRMPVSFLPSEGDSFALRQVPRLDRDGYPLRKDSEAYFRMQRAAERAERRKQREHEARERQRQQVERFARRMKRQREHKRRQKYRFEYIAAELATTLANLHESPTTERES